MSGVKGEKWGSDEIGVINKGLGQEGLLCSKSKGIKPLGLIVTLGLTFGRGMSGPKVAAGPRWK